MLHAADESVQAVFHQYQSQLHRYIRQFVGDEEAKDVLQDVFISFLKQKREAKIRNIDELPWLYRSCHNKAIDYIRKQKKLTFYSVEKFDRIEATAETAEAIAWQELREELFGIALGFDKKGQGALILHLLDEGKPKALIAETLEISDRHLRRKTQDLFRFLQQELKKRGIDKLSW